MKRLIAFFSLFLLLSCLSPAYSGDNPFSGVVVGPLNDADYKSDNSAKLPPIAEGQSETGVVDVGSSLNIRTSPWGDIIGSFHNGDKVEIIGQSGDWYKIKYNGKTAYIHSAYVKRKGEGKKPFARSGWVNAPLGLNVRRVPHGDIVGTLPDQASIEILGTSGGYYKIKWGKSNEAFVDRRYIDTNVPAAPTKGVEKQDFVGYISNCTALNVRTSPWGPIDTALPRGIEVKVVGKVGGWYQISYNGKTRYVFGKYISKNRNSNNSGSSNSTGTTGGVAAGTKTKLTGTEQQRIVAAAKQLVGSHNFRSKAVGYGRLACAQVVTTALKNAGALNRVSLNCRSAVADLHKHGWKEVNVPPFQDGDVITWKTYDYTGDGIKDDDTHIGIILKDGNSYKAMNNSSRLRTPRLLEPFAIKPVSRVLRKVA